MKVKKIDIRNGERSDKETRVYVHLAKETILENLIERHNRPYTEYRKNVMPKVLKALGLPLDTKFSWSQYAGCSCPCSPGFIIHGHEGKEVWATISQK